MKCLHIMSDDKFTKPYIKFINSNFKIERHDFYVLGKSVKINNTNDNINLLKMNFASSIKLITKMYKVDKIILHGITSFRYIIIFFVFPSLLKKTFWCIHGADLYFYNDRNKSFKNKIISFCRSSVIKRFHGLITHIKGDYELTKKWYGAKGQYYYSFMYPSNLYKEYSLSERTIKDDRVYIQVGNSADPSNNHLEVLDKLQRYKNLDIEIICPLSYGNKDYARCVVEYGKNIFSHKFLPITEFMPFDEYIDVLSKIDVAIFNHNRQQAMGNITTLLGLGKKVYIREEVTTWQFCMDHELKVFRSNRDFEDLLEDIDEEIKHKNMETIKRKFSEEKLVEDWRRIFDA